MTSRIRCVFWMFLKIVSEGLSCCFIALLPFYDFVTLLVVIVKHLICSVVWVRTKIAEISFKNRPKWIKLNLILILVWLFDFQLPSWRACFIFEQYPAFVDGPAVVSLLLGFFIASRIGSVCSAANFVFTCHRCSNETTADRVTTLDCKSSLGGLFLLLSTTQ